MTNISAAQAISPAIERTKQFLFRPFRLSTFLKLTLVAFLTEGGMTSCEFNTHVPSGGSNTPHPSTPNFHMPPMHLPAPPVIAGALAFVVLIVIPVILVIGYLVIRLRFSYFDCVLRQQHQIAPAWGLYHRQALRYLGLSLCIGVFFLAYVAVSGAVLYTQYKPLFVALGSDNKPGFIAFLPLIGIVLLLVMVLALAASLVQTGMSYFVLPHMALEDASISEALTDVWSDFTAEPWQYVFFILLKFVVTLAASIIALIAIIIPIAVAGAIGGILWLILKSISAGLAVLFGVPALILAGALFFVAMIALGGVIGTFRRNYALIFYGGRYPPLAAILQPPIPQPPIAPWTPEIQTP